MNKKLFVLPFVFGAILLSGCTSNVTQKRTIHTSDAPQAIGPYEQAIVVDNMVYCSGQIGINPQTGNLVSGGINEETHQVLKNLRAVLFAASSSLDNVVKTTVFLTDLSNFDSMNNIYMSYFSEGKFPARSAVEVSSLPKGALIEIECVAFCN